MMSPHWYACGQHVAFYDTRDLGPGWTGTYVIVKLLPSRRNACRYGIRSTGEAYYRTAYEHQLNASILISR